MKIPGLSRRRRWRVVLGTLALPPLLWMAALAIIPTERSRRCVAERLSAASGRSVEIGALRVGPLGGVSLRDLKIGTPDSWRDPWLVVSRATIDISLFQLLFGQIEPTRIEVRGFELRVLRREDGSMELSDFLGPTEPSDATDGGGDRAEPTGLEVTVREGRVSLIDLPTGTLLEFQGVEGHAVCQGGLTVVEELKGTLNGGPFLFNGQCNRDGEVPVFDGRFRADNVALRDGMSALGYLVPVFAGSKAKLDGRLSVELAVTGEGATREALQRTLTGSGRLALDPILLDGSKILAEFGQFVDLPPKGRVGSVKSTLTIGGGRVVNDPLTIDVGRVPVVLSGSTDFEGRINYRMRGDALAERIPTKARNFLSDMEIDLDELADVRVQGTVDDMIVRVNGQPVSGDGFKTETDRRERLREIGRRIRDRIQR